MQEANLIIIGGLMFSIMFFVKDKIERRYEKKTLPTLSVEKQNEYWERERERTEMGVYTTPFTKGKLLEKNNSHGFNTFAIILCLLVLLFGLIDKF